jgi:acyl-CoA synthetase (AMP-forming)/AMP-acid ligase II
MLSIVDRLTQVIIVGSANVYPADIESVLASCPEIAEAAAQRDRKRSRATSSAAR